MENTEEKFQDVAETPAPQEYECVTVDFDNQLRERFVAELQEAGLKILQILANFDKHAPGMRYHTNRAQQRLKYAFQDIEKVLPRLKQIDVYKPKQDVESQKTSEIAASIGE